MSSFFRMLRLHASDASQHSGAIRRMRREEFDGLLVHDVYGPEDCARLCERLQAGRHYLVRSSFPPVMRSDFLGYNLNLAAEDLVDYFDEAALFDEALAGLFNGMADFRATVGGLLSALDDARPYLSAPGPSPEQHHMFTTIRCHHPGGFIPPHFDNEQAFRESYRFVNADIGGDLFSFVLAFSRAEAGGALEIFDRRHDGRPWRMVDGALDAAKLNLDDVERVSLRLDPGDLILFNSSRFLHRVSPVEGETSRWTACSFMSESRADDAVYCWG